MDFELVLGLEGGSKKGIQYGCWRKHVSSSAAWWKGGVPQKRYYLLTHTASMAQGCCFIPYPSGSANYSNGSFFCSLGNPHALPVITLTTQIPEMVVGKTRRLHIESDTRLSFGSTTRGAFTKWNSSTSGSGAKMA